MLLFPVDKGLPADLTLKLSAAAGVIIDVVMRGATERADGICRNVTGFAFVGLDWFYGFGPTSILYLSYFVECGTYIIHENRGSLLF